MLCDYYSKTGLIWYCIKIQNKVIFSSREKTAMHAGCPRDLKYTMMIDFKILHIVTFQMHCVKQGCMIKDIIFGITYVPEFQDFASYEHAQ